MPSPEILALQAQIEELRAAVKPRPSYPSDKRPIACFRCTDEEIALIDAASEQRGVSRGEFLRTCVRSVLGEVFRPRQEIPPQFKHRNRTKLTHFDDGKTNRPDLDRAAATKRIVQLDLERHMLAQDIEAAGKPARIGYATGMLSEAASSRPLQSR